MDYLYGLFVADVAANRGVSTEKVLEDMADGRMFIGQQAVDAGLADGISNLEALISTLNQSATDRERLIATAPSSMDDFMNPNEQAAQWAAENPEAAAVLRAEGAVGERDRIAAVRAQAMPGHEALIEALAADGHTSGPEAAMAVVAAENALRKEQAQAQAAEAPAPVAFDSPVDTAAEPAAAEIDPHMLAAKARQLVDAAASNGQRLSVTDAVAQARQQLATA